MDRTKGILKVENVEITMEGQVICRNQKIEAVGVYGISGLYNALRDALMASLTIPVISDTSLRFYGNISFDGSPISYKELRKMMNLFTMFYSCESVQSSLEFVNFSKVKDVMSAFELEAINSCELSKLGISESRRWEAAVNVASGSKVVVLRNFHSPYKNVRKYLSFLVEHARNNGSVIFVEDDFPLEHGLNGCVIIKKDGFECVNFSIEKEFYRYKRVLLEIFLKELEVKQNDEKDAKESNSSASINESSDGSWDMAGPLGKPVGFSAFRGNALNSDKYIEDSEIDFHGNFTDPRIVIFDDAVVYKLKDPQLSSNSEQKISDVSKTYDRGNSCCWIRRIEELFTKWFFSVDIRLSLLLTRRKCFLEEKKTKDFRKFIVSFLMQVYLAIILKFKGSIFNDTTIFSMLSTFLNPLEVSKRWETSVEDLIKRILSTPISTMVRCFVDFPGVCFSLMGSTFRNTGKFIGQIRSYNWDLVDYKIISTGVYFLVFTRGGTMVNEERFQNYSRRNRIYSPGTYFFHIFIYLFLKAWIPVLLISYILNFNFVPVFLVTATFTCALLNLVLNLKLKYMLMCIALAFNLLYPLDGEHFQKSFFLRSSESFNLLVACRQFPLASSPREKLILLGCLLRGFLFIYFFFCYIFAKINT
ncbi:uncharacterized protein Eint_050110 [Encephalitozoon intestinalis ATCC 50506]|uniref:Uncharacterized protein n=1 Tax=Encephalitozoon intestinalis (strain ATCC 50506) TaxID=876142 RepID=E0S732_ENCIT|nr:uncharacterized protein Eint_050110 [Encephalitozoon intestinalis ATCC 50506]ADM11460.1 hypothetical protein Eint_050110 [Encephalitozoon intestinalis ATCC 50506]UTX45171.1 hypothetical protein GPK93_05g07150 [Encephalitozoon intestinalis]